MFLVASKATIIGTCSIASVLISKEYFETSFLHVCACLFLFGMSFLCFFGDCTLFGLSGEQLKVPAYAFLCLGGIAVLGGLSPTTNNKMIFSVFGWCGRIVWAGVLIAGLISSMVGILYVGRLGMAIFSVDERNFSRAMCLVLYVPLSFFAFAVYADSVVGK